MSYQITAVVRADGLTQQYGPYTREQAEKRANQLEREARRNAPWLSDETNAAFSVVIEETPK